MKLLKLFKRRPTRREKQLEKDLASEREAHMTTQDKMRDLKRVIVKTGEALQIANTAMQDKTDQT